MTKESSKPSSIHKGGCLCGEVQYEISAPLKDAHACYCQQCVKTTGSFFISTIVNPQDFKWTKDKGLAWYQSSDWARRGFCKSCGSVLCYHSEKYAVLALTVGSLEQPTHLKINRHMFVASKPDYYEILDNAPQFPHLRK